MKVALCISGQLRTFDNENVIKSLKEHVLNHYDCDIFLSVWDDRGISQYTEKNDASNSYNLIKSDNILPMDILSYYPMAKQIQVTNFKLWLDSISEELRTKFNTEITTWGQTLTAIPQLYKIWECNQMKSDYEQLNGFKYDIVIRSRPDLMFVSKLNLINDGIIYHMNTPKFFWSNRIYDIFFYSNSENMDKMASSWLRINDLFNHPFQNGLDYRDACRLLYVNMIMEGLKEKSMDRNICDVYRGEDVNNFIKFLS